MTSFIVCQSKLNDRLALIPENEIAPKEWEANGQVIEADSWLEARKEVDTSEMWEDEGRGWFYVD